MDIANRVCLVTGSAGFIGSNIVERLLTDGAEKVIGIDNFLGGKQINVFEDPRYEFVEGDIRDESVIGPLVKQSDIVFHEACSSFTQAAEDPKRDLEINGLGTLNILEALRETEAYLVHASTGSVYGEVQESPQTEEHPLEPICYYGLSKLAGEEYVRLYHKMYGIKISALRYYNVYGPRQDKEKFVVPIFIDKVLHEESPVIFGDGLQERCFTYVSDVVDSNLLMLEKKEALGEVYNVASGRITSVKELAEVILKLCGSKLEIEYEAARPGEHRAVAPGIEKIKKLGWEPKVDLEEGIDKVIEWLKVSEER